MGCGTVPYNSRQNDDKKVALRPYPEDINGINDKVANSFNLFLKNNNANPKPAYKERPKLNFDLKEKPQRHQSSVFAVSTNSDPIDSTNLSNLNIISNELFLSSISEKKSAEESIGKVEEKVFIISMPHDLESHESEIGFEDKRKMKFSISVVEDANNEMNFLEGETDKIMQKYF